jgi:hypothetical protein
MTPDERIAAIVQRRSATNRQSRQWARGSFEDFEIFSVPVELLVLNAGNRRFHAEKLSWEEQLGRELDPQANAADERSIISILLDDNQRVADDEIVGKTSKDAQALISDWQQRGQEQPLWIRPDGFVVNGNRRLAALKRLGAQLGTATGTYSYVEVIILDYDKISDDEMFQMEAREQLTEGYKVRYGDLNVLLTLREAAIREGVDWTDDTSVKTVASKIQDLVGNNASYAEVQLRAIRYMDEYLEYTGEPQRYQRMIGQVERFRDVGKNMSIALREIPDRALDFLIANFQAIQAGLTHLELREFRKLAIEDPQRFDSVVLEVNEAIDTGDSDPVVSSFPVANIDDVESDEDAVDEEHTVVPTEPTFPRREVQRAFHIALGDREAKQRKDAEASLREAATRLEQISPEALSDLIATNKPAILDALVRVRTWVNATAHIDV